MVENTLLKLIDTIIELFTYDIEFLNNPISSYIETKLRDSIDIPLYGCRQVFYHR